MILLAVLLQHLMHTCASCPSMNPKLNSHALISHIRLQQYGCPLSDLCVFLLKYHSSVCVSEIRSRLSVVEIRGTTVPVSAFEAALNIQFPSPTIFAGYTF